MNILPVVLLALLQGVTEFLPVSSSGHLVVAQHLFHWTQENVVLDAALHFGTALAIIVVFRRDIIALISGALARVPEKRKEAWGYIARLVVASVPAGLAGILFRDFFERMFLDARTAGFMLLATAAFLFSSRLAKGPSRPLNMPKSAVVGLAQALAILPGISRSGWTISTALLLRTERKEAGRFSFLLGLPAILGASFLELKDLGRITLPLGSLALGIAVSAVAGFLALKFLMNVIERGRLHVFGFYLLALGVLCLVLF